MQGTTVTFNFSRIGQRLPFQVRPHGFTLPKLDGEITMRHGDFRASSLRPAQAETRDRMHVHLEDVSGSGRGGKPQTALVELRNQGAAGETLTSTNVHAGIQVDMPSGLELSSWTRRAWVANIESDFASMWDNRAETATGKEPSAKAGNVVRLKADRGTIQIHKQQVACIFLVVGRFRRSWVEGRAMRLVRPYLLGPGARAWMCSNGGQRERHGGLQGF